MALPNSLDDKKKEWEDSNHIGHWMYVHELRALLETLDPAYSIEPNQAHNLLISKGDADNIERVGYIDLHSNELHLFDDFDSLPFRS
jgi:hypothetical protein